MGEVTYDPQVDVLRILLNDAPIEESDEDKPGVILDYDKDGNIVREGTERFLRNALKMRQFLVFLYAKRQDRSLRGSPESLGMERIKATAPTEALNV